MNYRNLICEYVVELILSFPTHCQFRNYGGKEDGIEELYDRIMKTFDIVETGHLQTCYTGKRLSMKKVITLIGQLVDKDRLEDVIDVWKEICKHKDSSDLRLVGYCQEIEFIGTRNGYKDNQFLEIIAPTLQYSQDTKPEEFFNSAMKYVENAITAKTIDGCQYYIEKLKRVLVSYPFIQKHFIAEKFGQDYLVNLSGILSPTDRMYTLVTRIKRMHEAEIDKPILTNMANKMKDMHLKDTKRHIVNLITTHPNVADLRHYSVPAFAGLDVIGVDAIMLGFDVIQTNSLQGEDRDIEFATKLILSEFDRGFSHLRGYRLLDLWKEACAKFKPHEIKSLAKAIEEAFARENAKIGQASSHNVSEAEQQPTHVEPEMKELLTEILATLKQLQSKDSVVETKVQLSGGESLNLLKPTADNIRSFIDAFNDKPKSEEPNQETRPVLKYEFPEGARKELVISGDPEDPLIKEIIKLFQDSSLDVKVNKKESPKLEDSEFSAEILDQRKTGMDLSRLETIATRLNDSFKELTGIDPATLKGDCQDPACPVHGENILPQRQPHPFDYIIGIDPGSKKGDVHHVHILKDRGEEDEENPIYKLKGHEIDFSSHRGFARPPRSTLEQIFGSEFARVFNVSDHPQPTATEIETTTHVVINQSFIVYDVKGEFFCEYKMNWNSEMTNFRFTHDKPDSSKGRRFHPIHGLNRKMTEDEALKQFQSLRRAALTNGPHKPRPGSFTPNW